VTTPALFERLAALKELRRTGWVQRQVDRPESVADHSLSVAVLAALEAHRRGLDPARAALLAVFHDLPEAIVGDRVPGELSPREKRRREEAAARQLDSEAEAGGWLAELWQEFETGRTPEARLVRALDRAEAALQAHVYRRRATGDHAALLDLAQRCRARVDDVQLQERLLPLEDEA